MATPATIGADTSLSFAIWESIFPVTCRFNVPILSVEHASQAFSRSNDFILQIDNHIIDTHQFPFFL